MIGRSPEIVACLHAGRVKSPHADTVGRVIKGSAEARGRRAGDRSNPPAARSAPAARESRWRKGATEWLDKAASRQAAVSPVKKFQPGPAPIAWGDFTMDAKGLTRKKQKVEGDDRAVEIIGISALFEILDVCRDPHRRAWGIRGSSRMTLLRSWLRQRSGRTRPAHDRAGPKNPKAVSTYKKSRPTSRSSVVSSRPSRNHAETKRNNADILTAPRYQ